MAVRGIITSFHETVVESDHVVATRGSFVRSHGSDAPHDPLLQVLNCNRSCLVQMVNCRPEFFLDFFSPPTTFNRTYYPFELRTYEYLWHEATLDSGCSTWAI